MERIVCQKDTIANATLRKMKIIVSQYIVWLSIKIIQNFHGGLVEKGRMMYHVFDTKLSNMHLNIALYISNGFQLQ